MVRQGHVFIILNDQVPKSKIHCQITRRWYTDPGKMDALHRSLVLCRSLLIFIEVIKGEEVLTLSNTASLIISLKSSLVSQNRFLKTSNERHQKKERYLNYNLVISNLGFWLSLLPVVIYFISLANLLLNLLFI